MESILTLKLKQGIQEHQKGNLKEAEILYRNVLHAEPKHPDANHNLGILSASINKTNSAIKLFKTALEVNPKIEQFWISYINALINDQQYENAKKVLKKAKKNGVTKSKLNAMVSELDFKVKNPAPLPSETQRLINYYQNGSMHDAKKLANSIIEKCPNDQFTWKKTVLICIVIMLPYVLLTIFSLPKLEFYNMHLMLMHLMHDDFVKQDPFFQ